MSRCYRQCFLCSSKVKRGTTTETSFHRFPKDPATDRLWREFCRLNDTDNVSNVFICGKHFKNDDFASTNLSDPLGPSTHKARLVRGAVPSVYKPRKTLTQLLSATTIKVQQSLPAKIEIDTLPFLPIDIEDTGQDIEEPCELETSQYVEEKISVDVLTSNRATSPQYIEHIIISDASALERAKRSLQKATCTIEIQRKKINMLHQQNRRLVKRVQKWKQAFKHLQKHNLLLENN